MAANGNFYITTTIPYVNAEPHLGMRWNWCRPTCWPAGERGAGRPYRWRRGL